MKTVELELPYFKKGDDLNWYIQENKGDLIKALRGHSDGMLAAGYILSETAKILEPVIKDVSIEADTHIILISGPDEVMDELVNKEFASIPDWLDEEDDEEFDEDELEDDEDEEGEEWKNGPVVERDDEEVD